MTEEELQTLIDDATFDYTMGENDSALAKLSAAAQTKVALPGVTVTRFAP